MRSTRNLIGIGCLFAVCMLFLACGELVRRDRSGTEESTPAETESDGVDLPEDRFGVPERIPEGAGRQIATGQIDWQAVDSLRRVSGEDDSVRTIYRVQLFASQYYSEAGYEKEVAQEVFSEPVYIMYDVPYYKIMIGNCTDLKSARRLLERARSLGYDNGWLVESPPDSTYYNFICSSDTLESGVPTDVDSSHGSPDKR